MKPYIGITGFMSSLEAETTLKKFKEVKARHNLKHQLMVGVLASKSTLYGKKGKFSNRYPDIDDIRKIFPADSDALNLIHYYTKSDEPLFPQLVALTEIAGSNFNGFQLNMAWPNPEEIAVYKKRYPDKKIVIVVNNHALEFQFIVSEKFFPEMRLFEQLAESYKNIADYVLIDLSGGKGNALDQTLIMKYCDAIQNFVDLPREAAGKIGMVIAGGLGPSTIDLIRPFAKRFPDLSIDAEGKIRDEFDALKLDFSNQYLEKSGEILAA